MARHSSLDQLDNSRVSCSSFQYTGVNVSMAKYESFAVIPGLQAFPGSAPRSAQLVPARSVRMGPFMRHSCMFT